MFCVHVSSIIVCVKLKNIDKSRNQSDVKAGYKKLTARQ